MSLGIAIKGSEGIVLAADSRVTLLLQQAVPAGAPVTLLPATFDNATKLLKVTNQDYVGAVTFGLGAMMTPLGPRTMQSFIPEFEAELTKKELTTRLPVQDFAKELSAFFLGRWNALMNRPATPGEEIMFQVGGYDDGAIYGRIFTFNIPSLPTPAEQNAGAGAFGISWGGQTELVQRLMVGYDGELPSFLQQQLGLTPAQMQQLQAQMPQKFQAVIPYQFLPLQDCVDLAVFLVQGTIAFQKFRVTLRGVGGKVEVATITQKGFCWHSQKIITAI